MSVASIPYTLDRGDRDRRRSRTYFDTELCDTPYLRATALWLMPPAQS